MIHMLRRPTSIQRAALIGLGALLIPLLAACGSTATAQNSTSPPAATTAPAVTSAPAATSATTVAPTSAPAATTAPAATATAPVAASPSSAVVDTIKSVIQRANQEEQQAVAAHDPTLMTDTATTTYYNQIAQSFNDLVSSGVTAIQLVNLNWGPITLQGATAAQATTVETWRTTFADGSTVQETDTNVYTLALQSGAWKVQDDQHPNSRTLQPPPGTPGAMPTPVGPVAPAGAGQSHSRNWAGYAATGGSFTAVSGTWTPPNVSAGSTPAADATCVGIGGVSATD
jgi:hypothetical protein